jgi:hypothetical protein
MFSEYQIEQTVRKPFSFYGEERRMNEDTIMFDQQEMQRKEEAEVQ